MPDTPAYADALTKIADELAIVADRHVSDPIIAASLVADEDWLRRAAVHIDALTAVHKECVEQCCRCCPALSEEPHDA